MYCIAVSFRQYLHLNLYFIFSIQELALSSQEGGNTGSLTKGRKATSRIKSAFPPGYTKSKHLIKRIQSQIQEFEKLSDRNSKHQYIERCQGNPGYDCGNEIYTIWKIYKQNILPVKISRSTVYDKNRSINGELLVLHTHNNPTTKIKPNSACMHDQISIQVDRGLQQDSLIIQKYKCS